MFSLNDIIEAVRGETACFEGLVRVVAVSEDGTTTALVRLDLDRPYAPFNTSTGALAQDLESGRARRVEHFDANLPASADAIKEGRDRDSYDRALRIMSTLFGDDQVILDSELRGREFRRLANEHHVADRTIRRHFYAYLWGGLTDLALAGPQSDPNAPKRKQAPGTAKRGRKPTSPEPTSEIPLPEVRDALEKGAKTYYLPGKHTLTEAYFLTMDDFFSKGRKATRDASLGVKIENILLPVEKRPTEVQFRYVCTCLENELGRRQIKPRQMVAPRSVEARRGRARRYTHGPGYRFEIDATRVQIRIVSRYARRNLIREATLYVIIDVWSGAYVGYALSLDPASWSLAANALRNCFTDKSEVFLRLGLRYTTADWVAKHLPSRLAADRGELVSNKAGVVPELGIKVEIMASMRPERKGTVEAKIGSVKHSDNFYEKPGKHVKNPQRRQSDGKKDAAYTLEELERLIVEIILDLNNEPVPLANIPAEALDDGLSAVTYGGLFKWGLANRPGFTRTLTPKQVFTGLLLKGTGTVTSDGISFKKQNFVAQELIDLGLQQRAAVKEAFPIEIRYDDRFGDDVWFLNPQTNNWSLAKNDNEDVARLKASFWEIEEFLQAASHLTRQAKGENILRKRRKAERLNDTARKARKEAKRERAGRTATQNKEQIAANTAVEVKAERVRQERATQAAFAAAADEASKARVSASDALPVQNATEPSQPKSVGSRTLELWRKKNANLGK